MVSRVVTAAICILGLAASTAAAEWQVDPNHSAVGFVVRHMVVSKVPGKFTSFEGSLNFDGEHLETASVEMTVKTSSVDTNNDNRDDHLRSADFFDVETYPEMTFKSTEVTPTEDGKFKLVGLLTIKDVTKEVTFDGEFNGVITDPRGNTRAGFSASTSISRQDFNISWNKMLDTGGLVVSDNVDVTIDVEAVKPAEPDTEDS